MAGASRTRWLIMLGLRTWWVDAVGTTALTLHVDPLSLIAGAVAVVADRRRLDLVVAALAGHGSSPQSLLMGSDPTAQFSRKSAKDAWV